MTRLSLLGTAVAAVLALSLAGCSSSGDDPGADGSASPTVPPPETTQYLPVPSGVELTRPGSQLAVGDSAVVAYEPRQDEVAALDISVRKLEKAEIGDLSAWQLSDAQKKSTPYYVSAVVENVGETSLGGRPVPLYLVNEDNVLVESTPFASSFQPCPSAPFPKRFGPGASTRVCLVYLAPNKGDLVAVSFRPDETFNPITWTGEVVKYEQADQSKGQTKGKSGGQGPRSKGGTRGG